MPSCPGGEFLFFPQRIKSNITMDFWHSGNAWRDLIFRLAGDGKRDFVNLIFAWNSVVGKILSERTELEKFEKGTLFVKVANNIWMQELILRKQYIIEKLRAASSIPKLDIVFYIGDDSTGRRSR